MITTSKLNLDFELVEKARNVAKVIANDTQTFINAHTTTTIERTICRLLGIDGVDEFGIPLPNVVVDHVKKTGKIEKGVALYLGNAIIHTKLSPQNIAEKISQNQLNITDIPIKGLSEIKEVLSSIVQKNLDIIRRNKQKREKLIQRYGEKTQPLIYIIVATDKVLMLLLLYDLLGRVY